MVQRRDSPFQVTRPRRDSRDPVRSLTEEVRVGARLELRRHLSCFSMDTARRLDGAEETQVSHVVSVARAKLDGQSQGVIVTPECEQRAGEAESSRVVV